MENKEANQRKFQDFEDKQQEKKLPKLFSAFLFTAISACFIWIFTFSCVAEELNWLMVLPFIALVSLTITLLLFTFKLYKSLLEKENSSEEFNRKLKWEEFQHELHKKNNRKL